ncbi:MAG: amidase [Ectothiorhodospiraceae bacterium]|nr:amidase [Ectothiorhodospiraceae bacterium]
MSDRSHAYDPLTYRPLTFHDAVARFRDGTDTPRAYLERCLETVEAREPVVRAFAARNDEAARAAADASTARYRAGQPLSSIDGMPIGIKDLLETRDMPTQMGCEAYRGNFPRRDNAAVWALRQAGAVVLGKLVTAELGGNHPGPTTNPFDPSRTPGGSSSGSAAAVGACMMPAAIGSQVGGSIIRPSGYCANVALKPSQGGINRGERQATSMSTHGIHAGCIEDMWTAAIEIVKRAGGDRGFPGLRGPDTAPAALRPTRLMVLETEGWAKLDDASRAAFTTLTERLASAGITLLRRGDDPLIESLERAIADARAVASSITAWENRWAIRNLVDEHPDGVSARAKAGLARSEAMTHRDYQALLLRRAQAQAAHAATAGIADAAITLACPGPATPWAGDVPGQPLAPWPTGDSVFNTGTSMLFAPCVSMPLMSVGGLPVGAQVVGLPGQDAHVTALARWTIENVEPVIG